MDTQDSSNPVVTPQSTTLEGFSTPDDGRLVSQYASQSQMYPVESLEVYDPVVTEHVSTSQMVHNAFAFSKRKAMIVSVAITLVVTLLTGLSMLLLVRNSPETKDSTKTATPQNVVIKGADESKIPKELQGEAESLLINGDLITRGTLKVSSGGFVTVIRSQDATSDQVLTLPNGSGSFCLDTNNCNLASLEQLQQLENALGQLASNTPEAQDSVLSLNGQQGLVSVQGTANRISVNTSNGMITLSTPQDIATGSSPTFSSLLLSGNLTVNGLIDTNLDCTSNINGGNLTTNASGQLVCADDDGGASGVSSPGGTAGTLPVFTAAQTIADSIVSQALGTVTIGGALSVTGGLSANSLSLSTALAVSSGGTGAASHTTNGVILGAGAGALTSTVAPIAGQVLVGSVGGVPTFVNLSGDVAVTSLGVTTIQADSVALGVDTTGSYVASFTAGGGLTGNAAGEGSTPTLAVGAGPGITVNADDITLALQVNKGLEVDGSGLSLVDCGDTQILKYSTATNQWGCAADAGGSGVGDDVSVNGSGATGANFINTAATAAVAAISWTLNGAPSPDDISAIVGAASGTDAGIVTALAQTFGGAKTFNDLVTLNGGLTIQTGDTLTFNGQAFTDLVGSGLQVVGTTLQTTLGTSVDLTSEVAGILGIGNGGTNANTAQGAINNISGLTTNGDLLYSNGTNATRLARGGSGDCLVSNATTIIWSVCPGSGGVASVNTFTGAVTVQGTTNQVIVNNNTGTITLSTPQDINTTSAPQFSGLGLTGSTTFSGVVTDITTGSNEDLTFVANGTGTLVLNDTATIAGLLTANGGIQTNGAAIATSNGALTLGSGNFTTTGTISSGLINGQTISSTANFTGTVSIQGANSLALGTSSSLDGSIAFRSSGGSNTVSLQAPTTNPTSNFSLKLPSAAGSNNDCLKTDASGNLFFGSCAAAGSGVTSLDGLSGALTIANSSGVGSVVTIDDATTAAKGIASFSSTNFAVTSGAVTIKAGGVTSTELATDAVTTVKIADGNVTDTKLATNSVTTLKIADSNVTNAKLANDSVTVTAGTNLANGGAVALGGSITLNVVNNPSFSGVITSTVLTGTAPLVVSSTTLVSNFNADLLDGQHGAFYQDASNLNAGVIASARLSGSYTGITGLGTVTVGTWQGDAIADAYLQDNITISSSGTVDWTALNTYPAACGAGEAVTQLGDTITCTAFAAGSGSGNYIQNQNASQQSSSNFWISGTGRADTSLTAPLIDTPTATVLNVGTTNATGINLNKNVVVAASQSLTLTGGNTGSRPGSPTEGMLYFDTDTDRLLVYANGKWQADRSTATKIVAPNTASQSIRDNADYITDGTDDQVQINAALTAAAGGKVYLAEGTYTTHRTDNSDATIFIPNNTTLAGAGHGTLVQLGDIDTTDNLIQNTDTSTGTGVIIQDLRIDGQKSLNLGGNQTGILFTAMGGSSGSSARPGARLANLWVSNFNDNGMYFSNSNNSSINNVTVFANNLSGIWLNGSSYNTVTGSLLQANANGVVIGGSGTYNTITGNTIQGNNNGINISSSSNNTVSGNNLQNNTGNGLYFVTATYNTVTGNTISGGNFSVYFSANSTNNVLTGNVAQGAGNTSFYIYNGSNYNSITGNTITGGGNNSVYLESVWHNVFSNNKIHDSGGGATNGGILIGGNSTSNSISGNSITDTSATGNNYAIDIGSGSASSNYLSNNTLGTGSIRDLGVGTIYASQIKDNANSNYYIQPAGTVELVANTNVTGNLVASGDGTFTGGDITVATVTATDDRIKVTVAAGGAARFDGTITNADLTAARTWTLPNESGTFCMQSSVNCGFLTGSPSDFIQNQNAGQQTSSNYWISGTARSDTSVTTPLLDTASAVALDIGTTNATQINLNENVVVAAAKSLTLTGGNTASRPASPTEGMLYFDTDTDRLIVYENGKWQADRSGAILVAANDSTQEDKDAADYVANGNTAAALDGDQVQIQAALDEADPTSGVSTDRKSAKVYLFAGTYTVDAAVRIPNNVTISGAGRSTLLTIPNSLNVGINILWNEDTSTGTGIAIQDLRLDGNKANNSAGSQNGIYLDQMGAGSGGTARQGAKVTNVIVNNFRNEGIMTHTSFYNLISGNTAQGNSVSGIRLSYSAHNTVVGNHVSGNGTGISAADFNSSYNTITGNTAQANTTGIGATSAAGLTITGNTSISNTTGISLSSVSTSNVTGNTSSANSVGIYVANGGSNTVASNSLADNTTYSIQLVGTSFNNVQTNSVSESGGNGTNNSIFLDASDSNNIRDNTLNDAWPISSNYAINISNATCDNNVVAGNLTGGFGTATINDASGGDTIYQGQTNVTANTNYVIQPASGSTIELMRDTNITGDLAVTGDGSFTGGDITVATITATDDRIKVTVAAGGAARFDGTITNADLTAARTWTLPNESGTICTNAVGGVCSTMGSYIQNQNASQQTTSNFWISGTGRADTAFATPALRPTADSTTAIQIQNAAGSNNIMTIDSTNSRVGIGITPSYRLHVAETSTANSGDTITSYASLTANPSSAPAGVTTYASEYNMTTSGSANINANVTLYGSVSAAQNTGGATLGAAVGVGGVAQNAGAGIVSNAIAGRFKASNTGAGSITNGVALQASTPEVTAGSITTAYGLLIQDQDVSGVGTGIGIWQAGASDLNVFAGKVGLGVVPTTHALEVNGTGSFSTSVLAPTVDTIAAGALTLGGTNATSISIADDTTVAAGKYLRITGDNTAGRPASPAEGMLFYDTTTKQLLTYSNGKWQQDRTEAVIVAASNSSQSDKDAADYVADGNTGAAADGDQVQINSALTAGSGKKVVLLAGTYTVDASISIASNTVLTGVGIGTIITIPNSFNASLDVIRNSNYGTVTGNMNIFIRDLTIDGNKANNTGSQNGIAIKGDATGQQALSQINVSHTEVKNFSTSGIVTETWRSTYESNTIKDNGTGIRLELTNVSGNVIADNVFTGNTNKSASLFATETAVTGNSFTNVDSGVYIETGSQYNTISANVFAAATADAVHLNGGNNTVVGNTIRNAQRGVYAQSSNNLISGNRLINNGGTADNNAIYIDSIDANIITNNAITDSSATSTNNAIHLGASATNTYLAGNTLSGAAINNLATGTVFGGQTDSSGNYTVQPATTKTIELLRSTNVTGTLTATTLASTVSTGTAPLTVASTTLVTNLNADLLDGQSGSFYQNAGNINAGTLAVAQGGSGAGTFTQYGVLFGNGTSAFGVTAAGTNGQCLLATTSAAPSWGTCTASDLQGTYAASSSPATINLANNKDITINATDQTTDSSVVINLQCATCSASGGRFAIQDSGVDIFTVNPNGDIVIGSSGNTMTLAAASNYEPILAGSARHAKSIVLTPEFSGAVLDAASDASCSSANSGTMTSGLDSANRMNYYNWMSTQGSAQCYDVVVQVPIPSDWAAWAASTPINVQMKKDSTGTAAYAIQILKSNGSADTTFCTGGGYCTTPTSGFAALGTSWGNMTTNALHGSDYTAGNYFTIKVRMTSTSSANTSLGNITLNYLARY